MVVVSGDTELEEWFKSCVWAKGGYSGYLPEGEFGNNRLTNELNDLFKIIARPRVQVLLDISEERGLNQVRLRVEPRMFQPGLMRLSTVSLSLESSFLAFGDEVHLSKERHRLDSTSEVARSEVGTLKHVTWTWDGSGVEAFGEVVRELTTTPAALVDAHDVWAEVSIEIGYHATKSADLNPVFEYERTARHSNSGGRVPGCAFLGG